MFLASFFKKLGKGIGSLFGFLSSDKVKKVYDNIVTLADKTKPAIELIVQLTPNTTDDLVLAALKRLGLTIEQVLDKSNERLHDANRFDLAVEVFKQHLIQEVRNIKDGKPIKVGDFLLATTEDVLGLDKNVLRSAVQDGYTLYKLAR